MHVTAIMPTIPRRASTAAGVVARLLPQVGELIVHLNGHDVPPAWSRHAKIKVRRHQAGTGPAVRFSELPARGDIVLFVDDDLAYPPDYTSKTVGALRRLGARSVVAWHGSTWRRGTPPTFNVPRSVLPFYAASARDATITYAGSGTLGFRLEDARKLDLVIPKEFQFEDDVWISSAIARAGLKPFRPVSGERWIAPTPAAYDGLYNQACADRFNRRNKAIVRAMALGGWSLST